MKRLVPDSAAPASPQKKNQKKSAASPGKQARAGESHDSLRDPAFAQDVIAWQKQHGRHVLPWQNTRDAYRVWLSEIMLQQTQVAAVIPYYERFLLRFPTVQSLADAPIEDVMAHWSGLGYYSRARNLHKCAQAVVAQYGG
ncbi:MAG TPA: A/G-specific adenine glycosylase, partial [Oxalicibacterium sp.]|nr:A/G-specific adenine glycosylase [Oxalicibacterium sp.]